MEEAWSWKKRARNSRENLRFRSSLRKVFGPSRVVGSLEGPRGQGVPPGSPNPSAIYNLGGCRLSCGIWVRRVVHVLHQVAIDSKTPMDVRYLRHFFKVYSSLDQTVSIDNH